MPPLFKPKRYTQKYRAKWHHLDEFKAWLRPFPKNESKAYCAICHTIIKAHLCDLRKHGKAVKHLKAVKLHTTLSKMKGSKSPFFDAKEIEISSDTIKNETQEDEPMYGWEPEAVHRLIKHLKTYWKDFCDNMRKKKDIWEDVAAKMAEDGYFVSSVECGKKFRNIKLRYFTVLERTINGAAPNFRIEYFDDLHNLLSKDPETIAFLEQKKYNKSKANIPECSGEDTITLTETGFDIVTDGSTDWTDSSTHCLLDTMIQLKDLFEGENKDSDVWQMVSHQMLSKHHHVSGDQCERKWRSLVAQFLRCKKLVDTTGTLSLWPYFTLVRSVIDQIKYNDEENALNKDSQPRKKRAPVVSRRGPSMSPESPAGDSDDGDGDGDEEREEVVDASWRSPELTRRVRRLGETAQLWQRLDAVEARLDEMGEISELQRRTNLLLTQVLTEVSALAAHVAPRFVGEGGDGLMQREVQDGITLVVPNSEQT